MELGPCNIDGPNSTVLNPFGWNSQANLLVVDQPIGVGWSYADYGETVSTTEQAAVDIAAFLAIFMSEVEGLKGRALHLSGESYAVGSSIEIDRMTHADADAYRVDTCHFLELNYSTRTSGSPKRTRVYRL